jgi:hypothetical protein
MPGKSAYSTLLLMCISCPDWSGSVCHEMRLTAFMVHGMRICFNHVMHFKLQKC